MSREELRHEISDAVVFWGCEEDSDLAGVMGIQDVMDVTLIRHAYVLTTRRNQGIGGRLLAELLTHTARPVIVAPGGGRVGDPLLPAARLPDGLARREGQVATEVLVDPGSPGRASVVLADERWQN